MNMKERMAYTIRRTKTTVAISSFLFLIGFLIADLNTGGVTSASGYSVTRMALGSLGIGLGFGLPCIIYTSEKLSPSVQIAIHLLTGCAVMLAIAFLAGWIPTEKGLLPSLLAVFTMLLTAFVIAVLTYRRQKKLAERINRELAQRRG
jgi:peptidoglycan/LPS O-acetylase OafA/YrhL